jgi:oligopeptide/dipeptide ABC transporter ATP-binding protein
VDIIVLAGTAAARAAVQATRAIPVVAAVLGDPVPNGLVRSLAKPGGNLTGLAWQASDLVTKQLQLLQETVPRATRVAALAHVANPAAPPGGCYFHPRCPHAIEVCRTQAPSWRELSPGHFVGCHRAEDLHLAGVE